MGKILLFIIILSTALLSYFFGIFNNITSSKFDFKELLKTLDAPVIISLSLINIFSIVTFSYMLFKRGRIVVIGLTLICLFLISYEIFDAAIGSYHGKGDIITSQWIDGKSVSRKFYPKFKIDHQPFVFCSIILTFLLFGTAVNKFACESLDIKQDFFYQKIAAIAFNMFLVFTVSIILNDLGRSTFRYIQDNPLYTRGLMLSVFIQLSLLFVFIKSVSKIYRKTTKVIFLNLLITIAISVAFFYTSYSLFIVLTCIPNCVTSEAFIVSMFVAPWIIPLYLVFIVLCIPVWILTTNYLICHFSGLSFGFMKFFYNKFPAVEKNLKI